MRALALSLALLLFGSTPGWAGAFLKTDSTSQDPFIIVHPPGYNGTGGVLTISVCASDPWLLGPLSEAITTWNALVPTTENCQGCALVEDPPPAPPEPPFDLQSVLLHELGHCAMGLGHSNWQATSFTSSQQAVSYDAGSDMIRGSRDDTPSPLPGTRVTHWFRKSDNNPVVVDSTIIDDSTFSRRIIDLPTGSTWPASANLAVSTSLGIMDTQAVMYGFAQGGTRFMGLSADEVNTVRFGMSGLDQTVGTPDDYTVQLVLVDACSSADIEVRRRMIDGPGRTLGGCISDLEPIGSSPIQVHFRVVPDTFLFPRLILDIDESERWNLLFVDGFEEGNLARWSSSQP